MRQMLLRPESERTEDKRDLCFKSGIIEGTLRRWTCIDQILSIVNYYAT